MSYFGTTLKSLIQRNKTNARRLSIASGVGTSIISRLINGEQLRAKKEDLEKLTKAISEDPDERAELIAARLKDEIGGFGNQLVDITPRGKAWKETAPDHKIKLPADVEADFETLRLWCQHDQQVCDVVRSIASLLREEAPGKSRKKTG